jgi:O-antigen ligase
VALFAGEIAVSGSRGALIAGFVGAAFTATSIVSTLRRKAGAVAALLLLAAVCANVDVLQGGRGTAEAVSAAASSVPAQRTKGLDAETAFRLEDELGHPSLGTYRPPVPRTLLGSSGRAEAWSEAVSQGRDRPALGYGFGTEDHVFVERSYAFEGGLVENTYIGLFLQLGLVGVAAVLLLLGALAAAAIRAWRSPETRSVAAGAGGVLIAGAMLGLSQSGLFAVGNVAATTFWTCALALPALAARTEA